FLEGRRLRALHGEDAVADLALGQPLEPTEAVRQAFATAGAERRSGRFAYMPNLGYPELRERAAADVGHDGITAQNIAMTIGAAGAIMLALRTFVDPGDEVIALTPYFSEFRLYCETSGALFVPVPTREDLSVDIEAVAAALNARTAAIIVNSPCNPSGHVLTENELREIATLLEDHRRRHNRRVILIADEVYHRILYPPAAAADVLSIYEHSLLARSFSKDLGLAGERIGYLALHPSLGGDRVERGLEVCMRALGFVSAPATAQRALVHLESWDVDTAPHQRLRDLAHAGALAAGLDVAPPEGALYLWARSPWPDTIAYVQALAERRVLITPGIAFATPDHVRLCFTAGEAALHQAFEAIAGLGNGGKGGIRTPEGA
ncbi:MAG: aminotransferase class I/II-fold pyridoxal phosphate-dependent enzyme, partial [Candidatus Dormibacteria bacterium]